MKSLLNLLVIPLLVITLLAQCGSSSKYSDAELVLKGKIGNANNLTAVLTLPKSNNQNQVIARSEVSEEGDFEMVVEEEFSAGIYKFSIGQQATYLIFNGEEKEVTLNGAISDLQNYKFTIEGAPATQDLIDRLQMVQSGQMNINKVKNYVSEAEHPLTALYLAMVVTRGNSNYIDTYDQALEKVKSAHGETNPTYQMYAGVVQSLKDRNKPKVAVGQDAPNIAMESPDGTVYELEDLEGKVVLLDFWASWCRPCRIANPHVVEIYDKYKDQGFTVYSVSLDGIDSRTASKFGNDSNAIQQYKEQMKQRWVQAIEQDKLKWDYHVSDLKKWESEAADLYGVRSIPRTFLIDREGKIAVVNPRNDLEEQLKKVLNKG